MFSQVLYVKRNKKKILKDFSVLTERFYLLLFYLMSIIFKLMKQSDSNLNNVSLPLLKLTIDFKKRME